jgi:PAS domain S-box-containing protein
VSLTKSDAPTLEDLRHVPDAAWLWDAARGRIVWANAAGISYFGGTSLFDLIDRPFDFEEPGVKRVVALSTELQRGHTETVLLHFPSSGNTVPLSCKCSIHALADGRPGVLVVAPAASAILLEIPATKLAKAFEVLPVAAAFLGHDGSMHGFNAAASRLLLGEQRQGLRDLLADPALATELLSRLASAATLSEIKILASKIGPREFRITLRRLDNATDPVAYAMLLLDDITERRALEKSLRDTATDSPTAQRSKTSDEEAFHHLGRVLSEAAAASKPTAAIAQPKPQRSPAAIPPLVAQAIDGLKDAVLITKAGQVLYANKKALVIFGHASFVELINDEAIWNLFTSLDQTLPATSVTNEHGQSIHFSAQTTMVAWQNGPARQFTLQAMAGAAPELVVARVVAPEPEVVVTAPPEPEIPVPAPREVETGIFVEAPQKAAVIETPAKIEPVEASEPVADDELRAILDTATDGIITLDKTGKIHTFSAGAEAIFGYRIAEVADKPFIELLAQDSRKTVRDYLAALQGPGLASVFNDGREVNAIVKQGGTVPLFLTIGALQSKTSRAAFCAVVRDITQWKRTEVELRNAKETAEATSRQKSEFLARISHELRTPLNAIMGFSEVMRLERFGEIKNDKYKGYVNDIHSSGGLLLSLINDLLDLSKVEAGQLELNFTSVNLSDTADNAIKMLQDAATGARVIIRKAMPVDLPNVVADQRSMRQIMLNIISNAIKFTDPGGQVIVSAVINTAGELKFRVKDTGIGMDENQLRDALEPFKRVVTAGREVQGTGLGLPLTKALAEANRTSFNITSEPRKGTLIEITFPTTRVLAE